jgi:O-antigen/teichoic acid export membrane protein
MGGTTQQIGRAMVWSVTARAGRFVLGMASSVIVVRSLGDYDYGVLSVIRTLIMFVVILSAGGLGQAVLKFLPALRVSGTAVEARRLVARVVVFHALAWAAISIAVYLLRDPIASLFEFDGFATLVAAAVALAFFEIFFTLFSHILNSSYDTRVLGLATLAGHLVYIAGLAVSMPMGAGVLGVLVSAALGFGASCLMVLGRIRRALSFEGSEGGEGIAMGRLARYAAPFVAVGVLNLVVWRQSETLLLGYFRGAEETGYFDLAYRIAQLILEFVPGAVWPLVMAGASETYERNAESLRMTIDRYYRMLFILCAPICVAGMVLGGRLIPILFSAQMTPAAVPTQLFFGIFTISFFSTPLSMALYVMEKTHINLIVYVGLAAVNIGLDLALIPRYGVYGAIVPVAIVIAASPFVYYAIVSRHLPGFVIPVGFIARCFIASAPAVAIVPLLGYVDSVISLAVALMAVAALLVLSFKVARVIGPRERDMLGSVPLPMADRLLKFMSS